ncbi:helix-turn-helix domain-containing protein [Streptomyces synnematoformans]|uniref:Helix-turn-helix domain-containing protein n=1 Tax=Streptomyces synnematoformans TaxID=415721 RepID=A0ABP5JIC9_9ACTN
MAQAVLEEHEVAERLKVSPRTLQNWRWLGTGPPYFKLSPGRGGRVRYRLADVEAWERARTAEQAGGAAA